MGDQRRGCCARARAWARPRLRLAWHCALRRRRRRRARGRRREPWQAHPAPRTAARTALCVSGAMRSSTRARRCPWSCRALTSARASARAPWPKQEMSETTSRHARPQAAKSRPPGRAQGRGRTASWRTSAGPGPRTDIASDAAQRALSTIDVAALCEPDYCSWQRALRRRAQDPCPTRPMRHRTAADTAWQRRRPTGPSQLCCWAAAPARHARPPRGRECHDVRMRVAGGGRHV
jgi:hypothetical protein